MTPQWFAVEVCVIIASVARLPQPPQLQNLVWIFLAQPTWRSEMVPPLPAEVESVMHVSVARQ